MLVGVVGPSGAGKDTLMAGARAVLAADPRVRFVRRCITRPAEAGGEEHEALNPAQFATRQAEGGFAIWWEAHGLLYGIPRDIEADLAVGRVVVANLSRHALRDAALRYPLRVLEITAPVAVRAQRLAARGRESAEDIAARLSREAGIPADLDVETVINATTPEAGIAAVVGMLSRAAAGVPRSGRARPAPPG